MIREKISELSKNMKEDHISESSAQCAYYTILSFVPCSRDIEITKLSL